MLLELGSGKAGSHLPSPKIYLANFSDCWCFEVLSSSGLKYLLEFI